MWHSAVTPPGRPRREPPSHRARLGLIGRLLCQFTAAEDVGGAGIGPSNVVLELGPFDPLLATDLDRRQITTADQRPDLRFARGQFGCDVLDGQEAWTRMFCTHNGFPSRCQQVCVVGAGCYATQHPAPGFSLRK